MQAAKLKPFGNVLAFTPRPVHKPVVILAEPDPIVAEHTETMLVLAGYTVVITRRPREIEEILTRRQTAAIVVGLSFALSSNRELMRRSALASPTTPLLYLRNNEPLEEAIGVMKAGAADVLQHPVSPGKLAKALDVARSDAEAKKANAELRRKVDMQFANLLTLSEREIVRLYAEGLSTREIEEELALSSKTLRNKKLGLLSKLRARNLYEAIRTIFSR